MPDAPINLRIITPSRRQLSPGDIFTMRIADGRYLFGRVIRTDANCFGPGCILVYVFRHVSDEPVPPARLSVTDLLIPPTTINQLGWSRGYFVTIGHREFEEGEQLPAHYFEASRQGRWGRRLYEDENGLPVGRPPRGSPVGTAGLGNYLTIDYDVSRALGLPTASG